MKTKLSENESKILNHLKRHSLTIRQAIVDYNINNVYDVILRLKKYGYTILKERRTNGKKRYATYYLVHVV